MAWPLGTEPFFLLLGCSFCTLPCPVLSRPWRGLVWHRDHNPDVSLVHSHWQSFSLPISWFSSRLSVTVSASYVFVNSGPSFFISWRNQRPGIYWYSSPPTPTCLLPLPPPPFIYFFFFQFTENQFIRKNQQVASGAVTMFIWCRGWQNFPALNCFCEEGLSRTKCVFSRERWRIHLAKPLKWDL